MTCAHCGDREAVVFMRRSGEYTSGELALCEQCARGRGLSVGKGRLELRLEDLLIEAQSIPAQSSLRCPRCGTDLESLRKNARIGCTTCVDAFRDELQTYFRARSKPPFYRGPRPNPEAPEADEDSLPQGKTSASPELELEAALEAEDYELAATIRDNFPSEAPRRGEAQAHRFTLAEFPAFSLPFLASEAQLPAHFSDVILETRTSVVRNLRDSELPKGSEGEEAIRTAWSGIISKSLEYRSLDIGSLGSDMSAALVESLLIPRSFSLNSRNLLFYNREKPIFGLIGETDQLKLIGQAEGLEGSALSSLVLAELQSFVPGGGFAFDEEFGYIAAHLKNCGSGLHLSAYAHLPALCAEGMAESALRGLLSRGFSIRGFYGAEQGSAGDLYEISTEKAFGAEVETLSRDFDAALGLLAQAERKARAELFRKQAEELFDRAGRALGIAKYSIFLGEAEAASMLSSLRLMAVLDRLAGVDCRELGAFLRALGPASLSLRLRKRQAEAGRLSKREPRRREEERLRAALLTDLLREAELKTGGELCSKD